MHNQDNAKICAVVVTYNRLELLKKCVQSLRNQTRKLDQILVVNNESNDGTEEWLKQQDDLRFITQQNLGGAGGFYTGIKTAYENGFDWIWCMDDDGYADMGALGKLIQSAYQKDLEIIGCLNSVNVNDIELPADTHIILDTGNIIVINTITQFVKLADSQGLVWNFVNMFNGALFSYGAIKKIGLPKKEMVIWGDEVEYFKRIKYEKLKIATDTQSHFYHPKNDWVYSKGLFQRILFTGRVDWKSYYYFRNRAYLSKTEFRFYNIKFVIAQTFYFLQKRKFKAIIFFYGAYKDGLLNNFSKNYLPK